MKVLPYVFVMINDIDRSLMVVAAIAPLRSVCANPIAILLFYISLPQFVAILE